jgi:hypothetical protein
LGRTGEDSEGGIPKAREANRGAVFPECHSSSANGKSRTYMFNIFMVVYRFGLSFQYL